jgi:HD-like signal output (HDOD) protein
MLQLAVDTEQLIAIAEQLTPLPVSVTRLNELLATDAPDLRTVEDIVGHDPALAALVLKSANSAMYARQRSASTVRDAVLRIGTTGLLGVAMRMATSSELQTEMPLYGMGSGQLFEHAVRSSLAAEAMRRHAPAKVPAPATVAALLHDTGKLVLSRLVGARWAELVADLASSDEQTVWQLEHEVFGADHATVSLHLGRHWRLPVAIVDGMVNHHRPAQGTSVAHVVHVANAIASATEIEGYACPASVRASLETLGIDPDDFAALVAHTSVLVEQSTLVAA